MEYFLQELETLEPRLRELEHILEIEKGVMQLRDVIAAGKPDTKFSKEDVEKMRGIVGKLVRISAGDASATAAN